MSSFSLLPINGRTISSQRAKLGLKSQEVARELAIHPSYYSKIEHDKEKPSTQMIYKIADMLGFSVVYASSGDGQYYVCGEVNHDPITNR